MEIVICLAIKLEFKKKLNKKFQTMNKYIKFSAIFVVVKKYTVRELIRYLH